MNTNWALIGLLAIVLIVSGCVQPGTTTPPGTTPPGTTPTPPSAEDSIQINILNAPTSAVEGQPIAFEWNVVVAAFDSYATHTAVHFDTISHPGTWGTDVTPAQSGYANFSKEYASGSYSIPNTFNGTGTAPVGGNGTLYFRAHAIVDGKHYWTAEQSILLLRPVPGDGTLVVTIKDAPVDENRITSLAITISDIQVHDATEDENSGWVTVNDRSQTIDLLTLKNVEALYGQVNIPSGSYNQMRVSIQKAKAVIDGRWVDVLVPSNKLRFNQNALVDKNKLSTITLDFDLGKSLNSIGNNNYQLKPVLHIIAKRNVELEIVEQSRVRVKNGTEVSNETHEFDSDGKETNNCGTCPQFSPPSAEFCLGGTIVPPVANACGCFGPPNCEPAKKITIELDDAGIYPNSITVKKGELVEITFRVREQGVYYGGIDVRNGAWSDTGKISIGGTKTVTFTADQSVEFKTYWPAANVLKATGKVNVTQ